MSKVQWTRKVNKLNYWMHVFYNKWYSIAFFTGGLAFFGLVQILVFVFAHTKISGFYVTDDLAWVAWVYLAVSIPAAMASMVSWIYSVRVDSKFYYFNLVSQILSIIISFTGGMSWTVISYFFYIPIATKKFKSIKKDGPDYPIDNNGVKVMTVAIILFTILGVIFINSDTLSIIWWNKNAIDGWERYLEVIASFVTVMGVIQLYARRKHSFYWFLACDSLYLFISLLAFQYLQVMQCAFWLLCSITAIFAWNHEEQPEEK